MVKVVIIINLMLLLNEHKNLEIELNLKGISIQLVYQRSNVLIIVKHSRY